jgi:hypothetical protein
LSNTEERCYFNEHGQWICPGSTGDFPLGEPESKEGDDEDKDANIPRPTLPQRPKVYVPSLETIMSWFGSLVRMGSGWKGFLQSAEFLNQPGILDKIGYSIFKGAVLKMGAWKLVSGLSGDWVEPQNWLESAKTFYKEPGLLGSEFWDSLILPFTKYAYFFDFAGELIGGYNKLAIIYNVQCGLLRSIFEAISKGAALGETAVDYMLTRTLTIVMLLDNARDELPGSMGKYIPDFNEIWDKMVDLTDRLNEALTIEGPRRDWTLAEWAAEMAKLIPSTIPTLNVANFEWSVSEDGEILTGPDIGQGPLPAIWFPFGGTAPPPPRQYVEAVFNSQGDGWTHAALIGYLDSLQYYIVQYGLEEFSYLADWLNDVVEEYTLQLESILEEGTPMDDVLDLVVTDVTTPEEPKIQDHVTYYEQNQPPPDYGGPPQPSGWIPPKIREFE